MERGVNILEVAGYGYTKGDTSEAHSHTFWQAFYVKSGKSKYIIDGRQYTAYPGDVILVPPKKVHHMMDVEEEFITITDIKFEFLDNELEQYFRNENSPLRTCKETSQTIMDFIFTGIREKGENVGNIMCCLFSSVLYIEQDNPFSYEELEPDEATENYGHHDFPSIDSKNFSACTKAVLRHIDGYVLQRTSEIDLDKAAKAVKYNKTYMCRCFSNEVGMSIKQYLTLMRINKAKELLRNTDYDVNHISDLLGYKSVPYFIKQFKESTGVSPLKYKKEIFTGFVPLRYFYR